jgi:predicted O-methyltransferase YrrM
MASMHWVLFACVAQRFEVRRILEIGTYDGGTTLLLSRLFPAADITTLDLPEDDPVFAQSYAREDPAERAAFVERQARNTAGPNIELVKENSLFLPDLALQPFDLIWVDGSHLYPEVAWDICNAHHLCRPGGVLMADDVMPHSRAVRMGYDGPDSYEVLRYLAQRVSDPILYFMKRYAPLWSADPRERKYVAMMLKG